MPAFAEYVLEGKILANVNEPEGPFGEYTGYSTSRSTNNVFQVTAVTHRTAPIYQDLVPGFAWEHLLLSQFTKEIILLHKLQKEIPGVRALSMPKNGCHFHAYLSMRADARGQARQAMLLLFGLDLYLKLIITVDEDVDVYNEEEVLWAVATHVQADEMCSLCPMCCATDWIPPPWTVCLPRWELTPPVSRDSGRSGWSLPLQARLRAEQLLKGKE